MSGTSGWVRRVALVSEHASPLAAVGGREAGGQNVYVAHLARQLAHLGCAVDVYTRRDDPRLPAAVHPEPGISVHHVEAGPAEPVPRDEMFPLMPCFADRLVEAWSRRRPDVVHAHFWMSAWASLRARRRLPVPVVVTFHALGTVKRRHQGAADTSPPERLTVERLILSDADHVLATCSDEVTELRRLGRCTEISVVPCGVGEQFVSAGPAVELVAEDPGAAHAPGSPAESSTGERRRIVSVSRLVPRKGIADVVAALPEVIARHDVELVIAGGPDERHVLHDPEARHIADLAAAMGVRGHCRFHGRCDAVDVAALMRSADVVVCAPWYEPFGIVPVEAMACGVPVVGSAVGGLLDTVVHGQTGLLVPPRRPDRLAAALCELLGNPSRRRAMGRNGAARGLRYRWPRIAAEILAVYQRVAPDTAHRHLVARRDEAVALA